MNNLSPTTTILPASKYWGFEQSILYGEHTILSTTAGIVDTGTTLILIATDAFNRYASVIGAVFDGRVGLLSIPAAKYANLKSLYFVTRTGVSSTFFFCLSNPQHHHWSQ